MNTVSFAFSVYLLGFIVSVFIAAIIKFVLFFIRRFSKQKMN